MTKATKESGSELKTLADNALLVPLDLHFDNQQMQFIRQGFVPPAMEFKWFIYFENNILHLHRSWTGYKVAEVHFEKTAAGWCAASMKLALDPEYFNLEMEEAKKVIVAEIQFCASGAGQADDEIPPFAAISQASEPHYLGSPEVMATGSSAQTEPEPMPGPSIHPCKNDHNQLVKLLAPSTPTRQATWHDARQMATCIPQGSVPESINRIALSRWQAVPETMLGWNLAAGINVDIAEPTLSSDKGKKLASGAVIIEPDGRVWVVHPSNQFGGYAATFPKGRIDARLSLQAVAIKETHEESGLAIRIVGLLGDFERTTTLTRYYLARRIGGTPADMGWESQAVSLVPVEALDTVLNGQADKPVLAAILKHLRH